MLLRYLCQTGRRRCVGEDFGKAMVLLFIANLVLKFKIRMPEELEYDLENGKHKMGFTYAPDEFDLTLKIRE